MWSAARCSAKLLAVLAHNGGRRPYPDAHLAILADKGAFGGNAFHDIFGAHRPLGWGVVGHGNWCGSERSPCQNAYLWRARSGSREAAVEAECSHTLGDFWQRIETGRRACAG